MLPQILIAGVSSGVGKTTITLGLIAALRRRGLQVQPFKAGPDYIDPTYHTLAAGRPCRNIDTWMVPPDRALKLYTQAVQTADIAVIEGVMGLFDGISYTDEEGSTAQIAKLLQAPVLLILDVGKMARSAGALALGYCHFDPKLKIAGFILNRCGSESHYQGTKLAVEQATRLPVLGWLPKNADLYIPERHLGLVPGNERGELADFFGHAADVVEQHFDLDQILAVAQTESLSTPHLDEAEMQRHLVLHNEHPTSHIPHPTSSAVIAVARDNAFSFYYEDNLHILHEAGAEIIFFSPQQDSDLPQGTSGIYLGGGFPEIYAAQLTANRPLLAALRRAHAAGMPIYAECGGFMYLTEAIVDLEGQLHPMVGLIPGLSRMQPRLVSLGYRLVESPGNFLLPQGVITRGHEFHWSTWEIPPKDEGGRPVLSAAEGMKDEVLDFSAFILYPSSFTPAWRIRPRQGDGDGKPTGYAHNNLAASYVHLHFAHNFQLAHNFVQACRQWREAR
jgi:cobyrinic acid a,c-diamide synthase